MIAGSRGGYCFEQNMLFRGGLRSLGFDVASLQARVVRGFAIDAARPMLHMVLRIDLPEGAFFYAGTIDEVKENAQRMAHG